MIQLLVVVAIVIVVAGIAVPSFLNSARPMRLRNDAHALANLITMGRMRASTEFAHVRLYCTPAPTSGQGFCQLQSLSFAASNTACTGSTTPTWTNELQSVYLSQGVSFGIPPTINGAVLNQTSGAYQGDVQQYTAGGASSNTTNPVIVFNSRGLPVDPTNVACTGGTVITPDYVLYLKDPSNNYYALSVNQTGHSTLYWWDTSGLKFNRLLEYNDGTQ